MTSTMIHKEIREKFLKFFEERGHAILPSASLVPENDPSVLFITAGMQPLVPYLLGQKHPSGNRIVDIQKCVRTTDIEEVGDKTHLTFFEMMGNWSLGDYFKEDAIKWSFELLTSKEYGFGLDLSRIYVTVFEGDTNVLRDEESAHIWELLGIPKSRIYFMDAKSNWWSPGDNGPCGPDTEIFYDITQEGIGDMDKEAFIKADKQQKVVEIWNNVFMEYEKKDGKVIGKLKQKNVDTGAGLERFTMVLQKKNNIFETDLFESIISKIKNLSVELIEVGPLSIRDGEEESQKAMRIIADHVRTAVLMISDGVLPSNTDRGYILRRVLRRAIRYADVLGMKEGSLSQIVEPVVAVYEDIYKNTKTKQSYIKEEINNEELKFRKTLAKGMKEFEKLSVSNISGEDAFILFSTYGFPIELTLELALEQGISVDEYAFREEMQKHQELSRKGAEQKFAGGLASHDEMSVKYHTVTHLLHQALRDVLGENVKQKGSNITSERLRFDFSHNQKLTEEEKKKVEDLVNKKIKEAIAVSCEEMSVDVARGRGALGIFGEKYGDKVKVYSIGNFSREICGGPHVENTNELGVFKIINESASSAGVRRIKAILS